MLTTSNEEKPLSESKTVNDYVTEFEIEQRLAHDLLLHSINAETTVNMVNGTPAWMLEDYDVEDQDQNTIEKELRRLMVLKSFAVIGEQGHEPSTRIITMAARIFQTPIAMITIVDLGRVWFFANKGVEGANEIDREVCICAHTITSKRSCFIIQDASKDFRFAQYPLVSGPASVRFYAGAPLITPEGYKIGVLCVASSTPRPEGISEDEQKTLVDLAATVVKMLVDRRTLLESEARHKSAIAAVSHEIMTPMTGLQLALSLLGEDEDLHRKMDRRQNELVGAAIGCSELMTDIYSNVAKSLRDGNGTGSNTTVIASTSSICTIAEFFSYLQQVLKAVPMIVPIVLDVEHYVQNEMVADESIVFRVALLFLSTAFYRTKKGFIRHCIYGEESKIVFEFEDTAPDVCSGDCQVLLQEGRDRDLNDRALSPLLNAASLLTSIQGTYGVQPRSVGPGSVFWFSISAISVNSPSHAFQHLHRHPDSLGQAIPDNVRDRQMKDGVERSSSPLVDSSFVSASPLDGSVPEKTALVIDDTLVVRKSLGKLLSTLSYRVSTAENGLEGLNLLMQNRFDIVLCDFFMPVMDGLDCARQFRTWERKHRPNSSRQFIVGISAHATGNDAEKGLTAGMDLFHSKPILPATLKDLDSRVIANDLRRSVCVAHESEDSANKSIPENSATKRKIEESLVSNHETDHLQSAAVAVSPVGKRCCLLATKQVENYRNCLEALHSSGWDCQIASGEDEILHILQKRNWNAVVLDATWGPQSPIDCINEFREWERLHRISRQSNVFLDCSSCGLATKGSIFSRFILPPWGFDGVLISLADRDNVHVALNDQDASDLSSQDIIMR